MFYQLFVNKNTIFYDDGKPEAATAVWRAPDDGHNNARNILSSVYATKQLFFTIYCCMWLGVLFEWLKMHGTTNPDYICDSISLNCSQNEKSFKQNL
jgi:hypothetical protein